MLKIDFCVQSQHLIMCEWCELVVPSSGLANHMRNSHPDAAALMPDRLMMMRIVMIEDEDGDEVIGEVAEDDDDQDSAFLWAGKP